ncbi:T9SS type A sorting domain-containing protein, partial [bacterium]|nr:T9SS type A sorting domain-containing protein [bacterium]
SDGKRAYRLIRVNKGNLQPSLTISAGANGTNFSVRYSPANDGTYNTVDAFIKNSLDESFEHALLRFVMPKSFDSISVTGGSLMQIDSSGENTLCYVAMNIQALSSQTVSLSMHYLIPSGILGSDKVIPSHFMLRQNYPNPFNAATVISYDIPNESQVILTVYDIKGRKLKTLVNKRQNPGYYSIRWNDPTLPSGLYFYSIKSLSFKQTKKMLYLK